MTLESYKDKAHLAMTNGSRSATVAKTFEYLTVYGNQEAEALYQTKVLSQG